MALGATGNLLDADSGSDFTGVLYTRDASTYYNQVDTVGTGTETLIGIGSEESWPFELVSVWGNISVASTKTYDASISKEDYLKLEKEIIKNMSVDKIFDDAKEYWVNKD